MTGERPSGWDPYRAWLNASEMLRPLNPYQLLDLTPDEEDVEKIEVAARLKRAALHEQRAAADPKTWHQVHEELEQAIKTLLDPAKRESLDRHLAKHGSDPMPAPDPTTESARGTLTPCGNCGAPSPATRRFCSNCGANLWEPCFECGTLIRSGEKFCGACGVNLIEGIQQEARRFRADLQDADRLRAELRFAEAIDRLKAIAANESSRLSEFSEPARRMMQEIRAQEEAARTRTQHALEESRRHFDHHDYDESLRVLQDIPEPLWTDDVRSLLDEVEEKKRQITDLESALRVAVRAKQTGQLTLLVEQLLSLQPENRTVQQLSRQLQDRLCKTARQYAANHRYQEARKVLEQLPQTGRSEAAETIYEQVDELACLAWDLDHAPVIDPPLLAIGERLHKLVPRDERIAKRLAQLRAKAKQGEERSGLLPVPWIAPPERTPLGFPVDWITGLRRIALDDGLDTRPLREHPGRFFVACGLALQGIELAPLHVNLYPPDRRKMLAKATRLLTGRPARHAWGIDLSCSGLKAVRLVLGRKQTCTLVECHFVPHRKALSQAANETERKALIAATLESFWSQTEGKADRLCVNLPGQAVILRDVRLPPMEPSKVAKAMQYEAQHQLPLPSSVLRWDYQLLGKLDEDRRSRKERHVLLAAVTQTIVDTQLDAFEQAELDVDIVQCDCLALHNFCSYEGYWQEELQDHLDEERRSVTVILDIGHDSSNAIVSGPDLLWYRNFGIGGHSFSRALVQEFQLTLAQAEKLKVRPDAARRLSKAWNPLKAVCEDLTGEIQTSLDRFAKSRGEPTVRGLLGVGGGFELHGLWRCLRTGR